MDNWNKIVFWNPYQISHPKHHNIRQILLDYINENQVCVTYLNNEVQLVYFTIEFDGDNFLMTSEPIDNEVIKVGGNMCGEFFELYGVVSSKLMRFVKLIGYNFGYKRMELKKKIDFYYLLSNMQKVFFKDGIYPYKDKQGKFMMVRDDMVTLMNKVKLGSGWEVGKKYYEKYKNIGMNVFFVYQYMTEEEQRDVQKMDIMNEDVEEMRDFLGRVRWINYIDLF